MLILPAIDIDGGRVARSNAPAAADPVAEATALADAGAAWLHVVDMDRVFGRGENNAVVRTIVDRRRASVQLGGGFGDEAVVREALGWGVSRVVVGPPLLPQLERLAVEVGPSRLAIGLDVREGRVASRVGATPLPIPPAEALARAVTCGIRTAVYRDLDRDGLLDGADLEGAERLLGLGADIVLAGGVASVHEIERARAMGIAGVIVGRALQDGRFTLAEAFACSG